MTHREFIEAKPSVKSTIVLDGLEYVTFRVDKLTAEIKVLNQWINQIPNLVQSGQDITFDEALQHANDQYFDKTDSFLDQVMISQQEMARLIDFYKNFKL